MNKHTRSVSLIDGHTEEMTEAEWKIPKKVVINFLNIKGDISRVYYTCPTCDANIRRTSHCEKCSQRLDWSDTK